VLVVSPSVLKRDINSTHHYHMDLKSYKSKFDSVVDRYQTDISSIRTRRASSSILDEIIVEAYDSKYQVKELATVTVPEPKTLLIQPWDKASQEPIVKAIKNSSLGLNPMSDNTGIRLIMPALTEERRKEFIKLLNQKTEVARQSVRHLRGEIWEEAQTLTQNHKMSENEKFNIKDGLQKIVDEYNGKLEDLEKKKEGELMTS